MTANGMAELEGSPKQIAWAEKIRATFFENAEEMESPEGEPVEETAESNEEAKMNRAKELVEKYNFQLKMKEENETLVPSGNIYTVSVKQVTKDGTLDEIKSLKPEMLKILMDRYNQRQPQVYQC